MVLDKQGKRPELRQVDTPQPGEGQVRLRVRACGICRTDLHVLDGELTEPKLPLVMGHQIVGVVDQLGPGVDGLAEGDRVGVPWLGGSCGQCECCRTGRENLCREAAYTGYTRDGGFAEYCLADPRFCFEIPAGYPDLQAAPLLCAGLIGYRSYRMATAEPEMLSAEDRQLLPRPWRKRLGLYGFGSAAHILCQVAIADGREIYAFTRPGDTDAQDFARGLGVVWAGGSDEQPDVPLDAAIIFAPVGELVPVALRAVERGGVVVCGGIHMSEIPAMPYDILWQERVVRSVANLTRRDGAESLQAASEAGVQTTVHTYPLEQTPQALDDLREGRFSGSAVIVGPVDASGRAPDVE
jgi:propanol-preferring alcohol dehydrogenase